MKKRKRLKTPQREPIYVKFGLLIAKCRKESNMTQGKLAKLTNRTRATIANIEAGRQRIYLADLLVFALALDANPHDIITSLSPENLARWS